MWALILGLNTAYELQERCPFWKLSATIVGLTFALAITGSTAIFLIIFGAKIASAFSGQMHISSAQGVFGLRVLQWVVIVSVLQFSFALTYRFAPNLRNHKWRWSTPGALLALVWWITTTIGVRLYFEHVTDYRRAYGHLNRVVMLLLWLYFSNCAILIGGEMNSEIERPAGSPQRRRIQGRLGVRNQVIDQDLRTRASASLMRNASAQAIPPTKGRASHLIFGP
jgi:membrane protein